MDIADNKHDSRIINKHDKDMIPLFGQFATYMIKFNTTFGFTKVLFGGCPNFSKNIDLINHCPACRTTLVATRFRVAVICPIIQVPHCIRVFFYFVWFVFINHIFQFYYELCTYCNILDIYLS